MKDSFWNEVFVNLREAGTFFWNAEELRDRGGFAAVEMDPDIARGATAHCITSGYALLEYAFECIVEMFDGEESDGTGPHAGLIGMIGRDTPARPAVVGPVLLDAIENVRRFRDVAEGSADKSQMEGLDAAVKSANIIRKGIVEAVEAFRRKVES